MHGNILFDRWRPVPVVPAILVGFLLLLSAVDPLFAENDSALTELEEVKRRIEDKGYSWTAGPTSLSRLSHDQLQSLMGTRLPDDYDQILERIRSRPPAYPPLDLPSRFDWGDSIPLPPIREQLCGDCWAQAVTAAMECQLRIHDNDTTALAVQQVIDCNYGGSNCAGGFLADAGFVFTHVGAVSEECYPYVGADMNCGFDTCAIISQLDGFESIDTTVVSIKTHLMTYGPIPVAIGVPPDLQYYTGGCYESEEPWSWWHAFLIIGWEDTMCGGYGAWHVWNCSGTDWGEDGFAWIKYGTAQIGADAHILRYTPRGSVRIAVDTFSVDDSSGDGDSIPDPGEAIVLALGLSNSGWLTATNVSTILVTPTPGLTVTTGSATFPNIAPGATEQSDPPHFSISIADDVLCGTIAKFLISLTCDQGTGTVDFEMIVGDADIVFFDDAEADLGWAKGGPDDDATAGPWRRKNPIGTAADSSLVQAELDHTSGSAVRCFVTGNIIRGMIPDAADVDGGKTTLTSPVIDLSAQASAALRYWKWYSNDTGSGPDDIWVVDVSADSGATWVNLETQAASERAWVQTEFDLRTRVTLTDRVLVRFVASDYGDDSTVEAAVDDIEIIGSPYWVDAVGPVVDVIGPNGGEEIVEGGQYEIIWSTSDNYGLRQMLVLVSYDGGLTFADTLGTSLWPDTTLWWDVPAGEHPDCRVRVEVADRGYNTAVDESDSAFAIIPDVSGVDAEITLGDPWEVRLIGSHANPFTDMTHILYSIPAPTDVRLRIYDVSGRMVRVLVSGHVPAGYHSAVWDGRSRTGDRVASGVYLVHLTAAGVRRTAKAVLER
jgi:hypothetical protein